MLGVIHGVDEEAKFLATGQRQGGGGYHLDQACHEEIAGIVWDLVVQRVLTFTQQGTVAESNRAWQESYRTRDLFRMTKMVIWIT